MLPVLFTIGPVSVSSFGFFLAAGFLLGTFLVWRLARAWDFDEEKVLDLVLLTFFGGLIFSRLYFALEHFDFFITDPLKILLFTKYPGLSFWGAFLGGWLTLYYFTRRFKIDFWQMADVASIGFLGGIVMGSLGCFLGGCGVGVPSSLFFAVNTVGFLGKRFPTALLESILVLILLLSLWPKAIHFHSPGKIASLSLIYLGIFLFFLEFLKAESGTGFPFSIILIVLGIAIAYKINKRSIKVDLINLPGMLVSIITDGKFRKMVLQRSVYSWYNDFKYGVKNSRIKASWTGRNFGKILKKIHVNTHPKDLNNY